MDDRERILGEVRTIAVVGLSDRPERPSYQVARYLQSQGYRIVPVNPGVAEVLGERAYPSLSAVPVPVDLVDIFRRSEHAGSAVDEAVALGVRLIWMQDGVVDEAAAQRAREAGATVIMNDCTMRVHRRMRAGRRGVGSSDG